MLCHGSVAVNTVNDSNEWVKIIFGVSLPAFSIIKGGYNRVVSSLTKVFFDGRIEGHCHNKVLVMLLSTC